MSADQAVVVITGATACGKTDLAMALADQRDVSLISVDSAMIYRGLDIGTAKPDATELARYPHALIDIRDPAQAYSVNEFVVDADAAVAAALRANKLPVLVGGTMMYVRAFREGLDALPESTPEVRVAIQERARSEGWPTLHRELERIDPLAAAQIHPNNPQRLSRALEVHALTGKPISSFWGHAQSAAQRHAARVLEFWLDPFTREAMHARIATRLVRMFAAGFIEEVEALRARGDLHPGLASMRAVGYRQVWAGLDGNQSREQMLEDAIVATRGLARRQFTWLRGWQKKARITRIADPDPAQQTATLLRLAFQQGAGHSAVQNCDG